MARMKRILITVDDETLRDLALWRKNKQVPASEILRVSLKAYTGWKRKDGTLTPKPESFEGVDSEVIYD